MAPLQGLPSMGGFMDDNFLPHSHLLRIVASYFLTAFGMEVQVGISGPGFTHSVVGYFYCLIPGFPPSADKPPGAI